MSSTEAAADAVASTTSPPNSKPIPPLPADCRLLYVSGDQSGIGKSSIVVALLHLLTTRLRIPPSQLAYIKPATQCVDVTTTAKYCQHRGIQHVDLGPVVFYAGYTQQCIDGTAPDSVEQRQHNIRAAVHALAQGKRYVLVDGVGYPAVGSVCGVSNAAVARLLDAPVLLVSRPGIGNAIDATLYMHAFFAYHRAAVLGVLFNKLPARDGGVEKSALTSHSYDSAKRYTALFFQSHEPRLSVYGHLPLLAHKPTSEAEGEGGTEVEDEAKAECMIRGAKDGWAWGAGEEERLQEWLALAEQHIGLEQLMADIERHYTAPAVAPP